MVIITENDDSAETTWLQKRHAEKNIRDFMPVYEPLDYLMHANEDNTAGNIRGNFKMKGRSITFIECLGHGPYGLCENGDRRNLS